MPSTIDLRRRIKSIKNTRQITRAMKMVSATKMRRAQNQAIYDRPYTQTLSHILLLAGSNLNSGLHPLLAAQASKKKGVLILSTDKGLCGALNTNLFRKIMNSEIWKDQETLFFTMGRKARNFIVRSQEILEGDFENIDKVTFLEAIKVRKLVLSFFLEGKIGEAYLAYPEFITTLRQEPKIVKLLPINQEALQNWIKEEQTGDEQELQEEFMFEPNLAEVLEYCLIHFVDMQIYQAILETKASEHSARMVAMQNATDNAEELVDELSLTYNQVRQDVITNELLEIVSAGAAL